jgi:hypothetical protein
LKSSAKPGREGRGLKADDFKYNRKSYWVTSREAPDVIWMEELMPSTEAVKAFVARDKDYATVDAWYVC